MFKLNLNRICFRSKFGKDNQKSSCNWKSESFEILADRNKWQYQNLRHVVRNDGNQKDILKITCNKWWKQCWMQYLSYVLRNKLNILRLILSPYRLSILAFYLLFSFVWPPNISLLLKDADCNIFSYCTLLLVVIIFS